MRAQLDLRKGGAAPHRFGFARALSRGCELKRLAVHELSVRPGPSEIKRGATPPIGRGARRLASLAMNLAQALRKAMSAVSTKSGLGKTFAYLGSTPNESATPLLIAALDSANPAVVEGAVAALIQRRCSAGQSELLRRLHILAPGARAIVERQQGCLTHALREAVLGADNQIFLNACREILRTREYQTLPALITALEDPDQPNADLAATTLLALCDLLLEDLDGTGAVGWHNPQAIRLRALESLELSVQRYPRHRRREVAEAFLRLASRETAGLLEVLNSPHQPGYLPVCDVLARGKHRRVIELLIAFLDDPVAPSAAITIIGRRYDAEFVAELLRKVATQKTPEVQRNLKRLEGIAWAFGDLAVLDDLSDELQQAAIDVVMHSKMKRAQSYRLVAHLLADGKLHARRLAASVFHEFTGAEANSLAVRTLNDADPQVQASLLLHIRARGIPGAVQRLIEKVNSPYDAVQQAARESLSEFNFDRYLASFESLEPDAQESTGDLVKRIDQATLPRLRDELRSGIRGRRLKGLAAVEALRVIEEVEDIVIELLSDNDAFVRAEAARLLARSTTPNSRAALEIATLDASPLVKEAAEQALQEQNQARQPAPPAPVDPNFTLSDGSEVTT